MIIVASKRMTLTFNMSIKEQAMTYEYLEKLGRNKCKKLSEILAKEIAVQDVYLNIKHEIIQQLIHDENFLNLVYETTLKKNDEDKKPVHDNQMEEGLIFEGLAMFNLD